MMVDVMGLMARVIPLIFVVWGGARLGVRDFAGVRNVLYFLLGVQVNRGVYSQYSLFIFILLSSRGHLIYLPSKHCVGKGAIYMYLKQLCSPFAE